MCRVHGENPHTIKVLNTLFPAHTWEKYHVAGISAVILLEALLKLLNRLLKIKLMFQACQQSHLKSAYREFYGRYNDLNLQIHASLHVGWMLCDVFNTRANLPYWFHLVIMELLLPMNILVHLMFPGSTFALSSILYSLLDFWNWFHFYNHNGFR